MPYSKNLKYKQVLRLFFDFYAINDLWSRTVGLEEFGYKEFKILPFNKQRKIHEFFESVVEEMKFRVVNCLEKSVRDEMRHFNKCGPLAHLYMTTWYYKRKDKEVLKLIDLYGRKKILWPLEAIYKAFYMPGWDTEFGGKKWAKATKYLINLKNSKDYKTDVFLIDRIFDLYHNTGFVLNKSYFFHLENRFPENIRKKHKLRHSNPLNYRFAADIEKMVNLSSRETYKIYMANKNYLNV